MEFKRVMIIDDSDGDQLLARIQIEEFDSNIEILQAYDGQEALEILADLDNHPDIIFLDINMPRMDGFDFLEEYSKQDSHSTVIAMLTSSDQELDKARAMSYNCVSHYFAKLLDGADIKAIKKL